LVFFGVFGVFVVFGVFGEEIFLLVIFTNMSITNICTIYTEEIIYKNRSNLMGMEIVRENAAFLAVISKYIYIFTSLFEQIWKSCQSCQVSLKI